MSEAPRPHLGVSHCLLGAPTRYDGGHRHQQWLTDKLARHVVLIPVCPEDEAGLGTPREPMHLQAAKGHRLRLIGNHSGRDFTAALSTLITRRIPQLAANQLDGFVLKARSPSCGLHSDVVGRPEAGSGLFARALSEAVPDLPMLDEESLSRADQREAFCIRLFAHARLRHFFSHDWRPGDLVKFHSREKMLLLAHDRPGYDQLGLLVAGAGAQPSDEIERAYRRLYMLTLAEPTSRGRHVNVLQHLAGHVRGRLPAAKTQGLQAAIEAYQQGDTNRQNVLHILRKLARESESPWVARQHYLAPCPDDLLLAE